MVKQFKIITAMALAVILSACSGGPEEGVDYVDVNFEVLSELEQEVVLLLPEIQSPKAVEVLNFLYEEVGKDNVRVLPIVSNKLKGRIDSIGESFDSNQVALASKKIAAFPAMIFADISQPDESHLASYWMYYDNLFYQGQFEDYYDKFSPLMAEEKMISDLFDNTVSIWFGRKVNQKDALNSEGAKLWVKFAKMHGGSKDLGDRDEPMIVIQGESLVLSKGKSVDDIKAVFLDLI